MSNTVYYWFSEKQLAHLLKRNESPRLSSTPEWAHCWERKFLDGQEYTEITDTPEHSIKWDDVVLVGTRDCVVDPTS